MGIIIVAGLVGMMALVCWAVLTFREPEYQGRTLGEWIQDFDGQTDSVAAQAFIALHKKSGRWVAVILRSRDNSLRTKLMLLLSKQSFVKIAMQPASTRQERMLYSLGAMGLEGDPAVLSALRDLVRDCPQRVSRENALFAINDLAGLGSNAIPILVEALGHPDSQVRAQAAEMLGTAPMSGGPEVMSALQRYAKDADPAMSAAATKSLALLQHRNDQHLPAAAMLVGNPSPSSGDEPVSVWGPGSGVRLINSSPLTFGGRWQAFFGEHKAWLTFLGGNPDGNVYFMEWETPSPVTVCAFGLVSANDGPRAHDPYMGAFRAFRLYARDDASQPYSLIYSEDFCVPVRVGAYFSVMFAFRNLEKPVTARQFRAEFVQNGNTPLHGPGIQEFLGFREQINPVVVKKAFEGLDANLLGSAKLIYGEDLLYHN